MPLSGPFIAGRYIMNVPNLQGMSLLSRNPGETGYTPYLWTGRLLPSDQMASLMSGIVTSQRKKAIELIRQAQTVMPKEEDAVYTLFGSSPNVWGLWNAKSWDSQFDQWVWRSETVWMRDVAPLVALPSLPGGLHGVAYSHSVATTGGYGTLTYSVYSGALPTGLGLNASTGAVTGTPTLVGVYSFSVKATDGGLFFVSRNYMVTIT